MNNMNTSNVFRSAVMQQFATAARCQARPPLALIGWMSDLEDNGNSKVTRNDQARRHPTQTAPWQQKQHQQHNHQQRRNSTGNNLDGSSAVNRKNNGSPTQPQTVGKQPSAVQTSRPRNLSMSTLSEISELPEEEDECSLMAQSFQSLVLTRRTTSHFGNKVKLSSEFWRGALDRAVMCGQTAPNHKLTEAFAFKRMIAPSTSIDKLADIAYNLALSKLSASSTAGSTNSSNGAETNNSEPSEHMSHIIATAEKKRAKWSQIPAFIVILVHSEDESHEVDRQVDPYEELPFVPPSSERDLENYASACAAVQNILLSLHSENIASKWATGPVIRTQAFRELIGASPQDRIVALVMVGLPANSPGSSRGSRSRRRKQLHHVLEDL